MNTKKELYRLSMLRGEFIDELRSVTIKNMFELMFKLLDKVDAKYVDNIEDIKDVKDIILNYYNICYDTKKINIKCSSENIINIENLYYSMDSIFFILTNFLRIIGCDYKIIINSNNNFINILDKTSLINKDKINKEDLNKLVNIFDEYSNGNINMESVKKKLLENGFDKYDVDSLESIIKKNIQLTDIISVKGCLNTIDKSLKDKIVVDNLFVMKDVFYNNYDNFYFGIIVNCKIICNGGCGNETFIDSLTKNKKKYQYTNTILNINKLSSLEYYIVNKQIINIYYGKKYANSKERDFNKFVYNIRSILLNTNFKIKCSMNYDKKCKYNIIYKDRNIDEITLKKSIDDSVYIKKDNIIRIIEYLKNKH